VTREDIEASIKLIEDTFDDLASEIVSAGGETRPEIEDALRSLEGNVDAILETEKRSSSDVVEDARTKDVREEGQMLLFDAPPDWSEHWGGMPEFEQRDLTPIKQVIVCFETEEDLAKFAELVGQMITMKTKSIWYPDAEINRYANKRYVGKEKEE